MNMFYNAKNGTIPIGNTDMNYISFGYGRQVLIMIPGLGDGLKTVKGMALPFAFLYRKYAKDYTVYVFSRKNVLPHDYKTKQMADDLAAAMQQLGIAQADVVGVSQGGMIAQHLAIHHPACVHKLVLVVSSARENETIQAAIQTWLQFAEKQDYKSIFIDTAERAYSQRYLKRYRMGYPFLGLLGKPESFARFVTMANACITHDAYDALEQITCPTFVIGGDSDNIVGGTSSQELAERIQGSQLFLYQGLGHGLYEEAKDFNDRVLSFLKEQ